MQKSHMDFSLQRKDSYESTSSSFESPYLENIEDKMHDMRNYPKISLESQAQMRKSVRKINNLRFLGILRMKDENIEAVDDVEMFKKIFKVTQKGLQFDQNQYFLQLNAAVMNNHLRRQASPSERLKVNLYDDEKPNSQFLNIPTEQSHQVFQHNHSTSLLNATPQMTPQQPPSSTKIIKPAKKATIRRRSCYCPLTGQQSKKGQRMDFLFPVSLIKNRIFMKMKRKQELKVKDLTDKDLIISNLNKTFDMQDKTSARKMKSPNPQMNPDQMPNIFNFMESTTPQGKRTSVTGKINTGSSSSTSQLQQGLSQSKSQFFLIPSSPKNTNTPLASLNEQIVSIQEKNRKSKGQIDQQQLNSPNLSNKATADFSELIFTSSPQKIGTMKNINSGHSSPQVQGNKKSKMYQGNPFQRINLVYGGSSFNNHHDGSNNNKRILGYSSFHGSPDSRNAMAHGNNNNSMNSNNISTFKKAYIQDSGNTKTSQLFGSNKKKEETYVSVNSNNNGDGQNQPRNSVEAYPGFFDKRKKLIAKLRVASKLVGIQEKQRKKSLLYHEEYYNALQNMDSNNIEGDSDRDKHIEEDNALQIEKKNIVVKKIRTDEENDIFNAQIISQQIIDSHNLRFNSTLNSFVDQRAKSHNSLLSNQIIMEEQYIAPRRTPEKINRKQLKSSESTRVVLSSKKHKGNTKDTFSIDSPFLIQIPSPVQKRNPMLMKSHHQHSKSHQLCSNHEKDSVSHTIPYYPDSTTPFIQSQQQSLVSLPCMISQSQCSLGDINYSQDKVSTKLGNNQTNNVNKSSKHNRIRSMEKAKQFERYFNSTVFVNGNTKQKSFNQFEFNSSMHNALNVWNGSSHSSTRSLVVKNSQKLNNFLNKYEKSPPSTAFSSSSGHKGRTLKSYKILNQVIPQPNIKQAIIQNYLPLNQPLQKSSDIQQQSNTLSKEN